MKKISLIALATAAILSAQIVRAQDNDTSKNKIEVKKKVKTGVHGRQVTKIKLEGKGTSEAINNAASTTTTGKTHVVVAQPVAPATPPVVVVNPQSQPKPATTTTTTTLVTKPVQTTRTITSTSTHASTHVSTRRHPVTKHVYHKPGVTTTTTTTVKKEQ